MANKLSVAFKYLVAVTSVYFRSCKLSVLGQRLVCLCDNKVILHIGRHINYFVGDNSGFLVYFSIRRFNKAVFIYLGKCSKI